MQQIFYLVFFKVNLLKAVFIAATTWELFEYRLVCPTLILYNINLNFLPQNLNSRIYRNFLKCFSRLLGILYKASYIPQTQSLI